MDNEIKWLWIKDIVRNHLVYKFNLSEEKLYGKLYSIYYQNKNDFIDDFDIKLIPMDGNKKNNNLMLSANGFFKACVLHPIFKEKATQLTKEIFNINIKQLPDKINEWSKIITDYFNNKPYEVLINNITQEYGMTAEQLGNILGYIDPKKSISKLVERNIYLNENKFSGFVRLATPGGQQDTRVFTEDGIYEITMLSSTEIAKEFRCKIRELLKSLRKGESIILPRQLAENMFQKINDTYNLSVENKLRLNSIETKIEKIKESKDKIEKLNRIAQLINN